MKICRIVTQKIHPRVTSLRLKILKICNKYSQRTLVTKFVCTMLNTLLATPVFFQYSCKYKKYASRSLPLHLLLQKAGWHFFPLEIDWTFRSTFSDENGKWDLVSFQWKHLNFWKYRRKQWQWFSCSTEVFFLSCSKIKGPNFNTVCCVNCAILKHISYKCSQFAGLAFILGVSFNVQIIK